MTITKSLVLAPRYSLDNVSFWLKGIDSSRYYWINVNGDTNFEVAIPGLTVTSFSEWKDIIVRFRFLEIQESLTIKRPMGGCVIHCISSNCYAVESKVNNAPVWHLFDRESLESLLMTSHPDWNCMPKDVNLGRRMLARSYCQVAVA